MPVETEYSDKNIKSVMIVLMSAMFLTSLDQTIVSTSMSILAGERALRNKASRLDSPT